MACVNEIAAVVYMCTHLRRQRTLDAALEVEASTGLK